MNVLIAIDSFKGSLSSLEAGNAAAMAAREVFPDASVTVSPLADGGEGTMDAIAACLGGEICSVDVTGPMGESVTARYAVVKERKLAVIEMAEAAGLTLVPKDKRDPKVATTYGVGELIMHALNINGCRDFIVCIGGSATNDGGVGMLKALGFDFLDQKGNSVPEGAQGLGMIRRIVTENLPHALSKCNFMVACDVKNPLCGVSGASAVYGPQKGASEADVKIMDECLGHFADLTAEKLGNDLRHVPGVGAAGGMGFAFLAYLGGQLRPGIELVADVTALEEKIKNADIVITGEGRLDAQSAMGKAPVGVARLAKKHGKLCIALSGCVGDGAEACNQEGIDAFFPIVQAPCPLEDAMKQKNAQANMKKTAKQALLLVKALKYS